MTNGWIIKTWRKKINFASDGLNKLDHKFAFDNFEKQKIYVPSSNLDIARKINYALHWEICSPLIISIIKTS